MDSPDRDNNFKVAYTVSSCFGDTVMEIRPTANAWWKEASKVVRLLEAFDSGLNVQEASYAAGISLRQYKYFAKFHPLIHKRRKLIKQEMTERVGSLLARRFLRDSSFKNTIQFLRHKEPHVFDMRYKSPLARLKRLYKIPANPVPKTEDKKLQEMRDIIEGHRRDYFKRLETNPEN